jgi:putative NIF3 family GTP cyclohydrolase 1 type 2
VNDALAQELGLCNTTPLCAHEKDMQCGMGRIGELPTPLAPNALVQQVRAFCPWLLEAGPRPRTVARVALCGGSGSDLAEMALTAGADVFLTAEIRHHTARWAEEAGLWLLDGGHFATEYGAMRRLCQQLAEQMQRAGLDVPIRLARQESPLHLTG